MTGKVHTIAKPAAEAKPVRSAQVQMQFKKSTKGTHVYETGDESLCTQVYLKKSAFPSPEQPPQKITLVVQFD